MQRFWAHTARVFCLLSKPQASGLAWAWACALLLFVSNAYAGQVTLAWDAVSSPSLSGYRLYYGQTSGSYASHFDVSTQTTSYTVSGLTDGQTYYFGVTAYDTDEESAFSNQVSATVSGNTSGSGTIPQQQMRVVSVDSEDPVGGNYAAVNALDGDPATMWHTEWAQSSPAHPHTLVLDVGGLYQVDGFRYLPRQDGNPNGTIAGYQFDVSTDGTTWGTAVAAGTLAADTTEKTVRFTAKTGRYVRLVALSEINGQPWTSAAELNIFGTAVVSTPTSSLIPQQQYHVVSVDSEDLVGGNYAATNAIDGNTATFWHTEWYQRTAPLPHTLVLDLGASYQVDGFRYLPRQDGTVNGTIAGYQFDVSIDGTTWGTAVAAGTLAADTTEKTVLFTAKAGRYVRLVALSEINGQPWTSAAELNIFGSVTQPTGSAPTAASSATPTSGPAPSAGTSTKTAPPPPKPVAAFSATPTSGRLPLKVAFTDASTGSITTWAWDFGDSSTSTLRQPSHTYTTPGTYTVKLTVTGPGGGNTATETGYITVAPALLEVGDVTVDYVWKRITFRQVFVDPIVVATPLSSNDFAPAIIRIRNVGPTGFDIRVQEWDYLDGVHLPETVSYLAMERGSHTLGTSIRVEAGRMTTNQITSWPTVSFQQGFQVAPVLLTAVTSFNEADTMITRVDGVSARGFQIRLQEQTSNSPSHGTENIDYIAWEPSAGTVDGLLFEVKTTANVVTDQVYTLQFTESFLTPPMFLAGMQTTRGTDPATLRWDDKDQSQVVIQVQEEVSTAPNLTHSAEVVGYMAFTYP
jgi:PKD repeat protein